MFRRKKSINLSMRKAMNKTINKHFSQNEYTESERNFKLKIGDKGEKVRNLQEMLNDIVEFYPSINYLDVDSIYGKKVFNSVKRFQELMGIYDTGVVDSITWNKLQLIHSKKSAMKSNSKMEEKRYEEESKTKNNFEKLEKNEIEEIQENINKASVYYMEIPKVKIDGIYGEETKNAIKIFSNIFSIKENTPEKNIMELLKKVALGIKA